MELEIRNINFIAFVTNALILYSLTAWLTAIEYEQYLRVKLYRIFIRNNLY
jgi:hypothetical protein